MSEHPEDDLPVLPYAGTSGYAQGSATSEKAVRKRDEEGLTETRQRWVLSWLAAHPSYGITYNELQTGMDIGPQSAAPVLSNLHKEGRLVRLKAEREGCQVYVLPEHVAGREVSPRGSHGATPLRTLEAELKAFRRRAREAKAANEWTPAFADGFRAAIELLELHRDIARSEEEEDA